MLITKAGKLDEKIENRIKIPSPTAKNIADTVLIKIVVLFDSYSMLKVLEIQNKEYTKLLTITAMCISDSFVVSFQKA